uniref:Uncharacterized protein n=1 Tax=Anguilla anguilla TaxID=7936 RepID=A0A0E9QBY0_ANGAN
MPTTKKSRRWGRGSVAASSSTERRAEL